LLISFVLSYFFSSKILSFLLKLSIWKYFLLVYQFDGFSTINFWSLAVSFLIVNVNEIK
jgi:hypothetical protein